MTALDPALCARLVSEAREDDAKMTPGPWTHDDVAGEVHGDGAHEQGPVLIARVGDESLCWDCGAIARTRNNLRALADQLEAALAEIEELRCLDMCAFVDGELDQARADKFRAHLARCELCQRGVVANMELAARFSDAKSR
jgi:hypothetical protein